MERKWRVTNDECVVCRSLEGYTCEQKGRLLFAHGVGIPPSPLTHREQRKLVQGTARALTKANQRSCDKRDRPLTLGEDEHKPK